MGSILPVQSAAHLFRRSAHLVTAKDVDSDRHRRERGIEREGGGLCTARCGNSVSYRGLPKGLAHRLNCSEMVDRKSEINKNLFF